MGAISTLRLPDHRPTAEINITPLIDVMLALLLIFMLATPMLTQRLLLPQSGEPARNAKPYVLDLRITPEGQVLRDG
jgi:biopolymer transport protein ExbD